MLLECLFCFKGDTHGQFYDVLNLFSLNGFPSNENPYVVNGDWVDRGSFGTEIALVFFCYKLLYPQSFHLLRGNHESAMCTQEYGFKNEVFCYSSCFNNYCFLRLKISIMLPCIKISFIFLMPYLYAAL
jgi:serine/threonine-protein phosphatase 5